MKTTKKVRIAGFVLLGIGIALIITGAVLNNLNMFLALSIPGIFLTIASIIMVIVSFIIDGASAVSKVASTGLPDLAGNIITKVTSATDAARFKNCPYCGYKNPRSNGRCDGCGGSMK